MASRSLKSLRVASRGAPRVASQRVTAASYSLLARSAVGCCRCIPSQIPDFRR
jgi:hypothetical protein